MIRKLVSLAAAVFSISVVVGCHGRGSNAATTDFDVAKYRRDAAEISDLSGHIRTQQDARRLVDLVTEIFAPSVPREWTSPGIKARIARAEYESATDSQKLIPEQRVADAWNGYVIQIGAPSDTQVTAAEIHNLRDAQYTIARVSWKPGIPNVWTVPSIFAVGPDGKVANGCRAVEALRVLSDLAMSRNIAAARERVRRNVLVSDTIKYPATTGGRSEVRIEAHAEQNPVRAAAERYVREHGASALNSAVQQLLEKLFPAIS